MSRRTRGRMARLVAALVVAAVYLAIVYITDFSMIAALVAAALLLLPSRIQSHRWRDFYRGRRLLGRGEWDAAAAHFERFLGQVRRDPARKRLISMQWGAYTLDIEAMALNNLGVAQLGAGRHVEARKAFREALAVDAKYAVPYFNLARIAAELGELPEARRLLAEAERLGYDEHDSRSLMQRLAGAFARVEGAGISVQPGQCVHCGYDLTGNTSGRCPECGERCGTQQVMKPS